MLTGKFQTDCLEFRFSQYRLFRVQITTCLYRKLRNLNLKKNNQHVARYVGFA